MANPNPGDTIPLSLNFYNQTSGILDDPSLIQLDITTGGNVGLVPDTAGPFYYAGAGSGKYNDFEGGVNGTTITTGNSGSTGSFSETAFNSVTLGGTASAIFAANTAMQDFEEGTNGVTISTGNSAASSSFPYETPFSSVALGAGATAIYDNSRAAHGTLSGLLTSGASFSTVKLNMTSPSTSATQAFRMNAFFPANPSASVTFLFIGNPGTLVARYHLNTNGTIGIDTAGGNNMITTTNSIPVNKWIRIEGWVTGDPSVGQISVSIYSNVDDTVPLETKTSAANQNTTGVPNLFQWGITNATGINYTFSVDDLAMIRGTSVGPTNQALPPQGQLSALVGSGASSTTATLQYNTANTQMTQYFRDYVYLQAYPAVTANILVIQDGFSNVLARLSVNSTGHVTMDSSSATNVIVSTSVIPIGKWCRISGFVSVDPIVGQIGFTLNFTNTESTTPDETQTSTATLNTGVNPPAVWQFGILNAVLNFSYYFGNIFAGSVVPVNQYTASAPTATIYRIGIGNYQINWPIPYSMVTGSYTANWTVTYQGNVFVITENFYVGNMASGYVPPPPGVVGYWTGSISFQPSYTSSPLTVTMGAIDSYGIQWFWTQLDGWDGVDVAGQVVQRASDHGGYPTEQFLAPRVMTWSVLAIAPDQATRDIARALFQQVVPINNLATFTYNEPIPKQAMVRRSGRVIESYATLTEVAFSVPMVAPDPRKYSVTKKSVTGTFGNNITPVGITVPFVVPWTLPGQAQPGGIFATNSGNFQTRPVLTVTGPITSPKVTNVNSGKAITWTGLVLGSADVLTVDLDSKQAILNGNAIRPADFTSAWWVLDPGTTEIQLGGQTAGGASLTAAWQDAWM